MPSQQLTDSHTKNKQTTNKQNPGNEAAAVVNTAVANTLGIFITPGLVFLMLGNLSSVSIGSIFVKLTLRVLVPFLIGQIIRNFCGGEKFIKKHKPSSKKLLHFHFHKFFVFLLIFFF